jgi:hypothetical protein
MVAVKRSPVQIAMILLGNLIPVFGCLFLQWSLLETFLFYAAELCVYELTMIPKIVLFTFRSGEYAGESAVKKAFITLCWIVFHLGLFLLTMMFLVQSAFARSSSSATIDYHEMESFAKRNFLSLIILLVDYSVVWVTDFTGIRKKGKAFLQSLLAEICLVYLIVLTVLGIINGAANFFRLDIRNHQISMLFAVVILKSGAQILGIGKKRSSAASE